MRMKKVPVSGEEYCCDSVIFPSDATIAPEMAWTMPGLSGHLKVTTQWLPVAVFVIGQL
jgi:hypothetical protein